VPANARGLKVKPATRAAARRRFVMEIGSWKIV